MFFFLTWNLSPSWLERQSTCQIPSKIKNTTHFVSLTCRDGVSEGQFSQVLLYEVDAIRKVLFVCVILFFMYLRLRFPALFMWFCWYLYFCTQACASLEEGYLPPVIFIVVQKRHHTRLFPEDHHARDLTDRSGNILPGKINLLWRNWSWFWWSLII